MPRRISSRFSPDSYSEAASRRANSSAKAGRQGLSKAPYGVRPVEHSQQDEHRWLNELPPPRISGPDPVKFHVVDDDEWIM